MENQMDPGLCRRFADLLGGHPEPRGTGCSVGIPRSLPVKVLGRPAPSTAMLEFAYEAPDADGLALCLGEVALLQEEVNPFISVLARYRIPVTALHNHWLYDQPKLYYLHFAAIDRPLDFALKVREASYHLR
ncbi:DUF1259 domain-containing protein [Cohnella candidum]|uniref:DUF1259 domain-containing protein n=1 Tax=Cohnella candidum TaxID=2674991 RepID=A0A3G3JT76_9BACL|nr:DUF1259 domain-containing protein [Cohnella candidum]AYQ71426.1 DUF1259 domain-containing protein [Cohnella candidum]